MPLYDYARKGIPLPRPIEARKTTVHALTLEKWLDPSEHSFNYPSKQLTREEREKAHKAFGGASIAPPSTGLHIRRLCSSPPPHRPKRPTHIQKSSLLVIPEEETFAIHPLHVHVHVKLQHRY